MKVGVTGINVGPGAQSWFVSAVAQLAEEMDFESIWAFDHVVVPSGYQSPYPYSPSGRMAGADDTPFAEPLVWLAQAGALTERVKLATGVLVLPQRNPVVVAKQAATLDRLSNGRLILGVGSGWLREEFEALGAEFSDRAARLEEYVAVMRALWQEGETTFEGKYVTLDRVHCNPKPVQVSGIPIVLGGHSAAMMRRAGRIADGVFLPPLPVPELSGLLETLRDSLAQAGRPAGSCPVTCFSPPEPELLAAYEGLGVERVLVRPVGTNLEELRASLSAYGPLATTGG